MTYAWLESLHLDHFNAEQFEIQDASCCYTCKTSDMFLSRHRFIRGPFFVRCCFRGTLSYRSITVTDLDRVSLRYPSCGLS